MQQHGGFVQPGPLEGSKLTLPAQTLAGNDGSYRDQVKSIALGTGLSMSGGVLRAVGSAFDGAVATWADLPVGLVTPVLESVYLVRSGSGVWLLNRKKSGLYQRVALTGDRAADWSYLGEWLEEFSDANFEIWHDDDTTRGLKFSLADQATGTTVTVRSNDLAALGTMAAGWSGVSGHLLRTDNPHAVTAAQVGMGSVDNTRDADKPVSTAQAAAIGARAPLVHGHAAEDISDSTYVGRGLLTASSAAVQRNLIGVTPWATNQWTNGTTDDVPEGSQLYFTAARANACADARIAAQKGQAEGIMPLDSGGKAPLAYIPDAIIGQVKFKGVWDAATNSPVLPSATTSMGHYYVTSVAGSYGGIDYDVGDWCISDGTTWGKVDNSDSITSFAGRVGAILPIASDYSSFYLGLSAQAADSAKLGGVAAASFSQTSHTHAFSSLTSKPTTLAGYGITDAATAGHTHSGYETAIGNPSANGYLLSSTTAGVRSWVAPYSHPATHAQSVIDSSTGWITTALAGKQASGNYAAGVTANGDAYSARYCSGLSETAAKLAVARGIKLNSFGTYAGAPSFDGSVDVELCVPRAYSGFADTSMASVAGYGNSMGFVYASDSPVGSPALVRFLQLSYSDSSSNAWQTQFAQLGTTGQLFMRSQEGGAIGNNFGDWYKVMTSGSHPDLESIENLAGTAGVPVKTAANTWELKNGKTAAVVIGGTTLNFQNGVLMSVSP